MNKKHETRNFFIAMLALALLLLLLTTTAQAFRAWTPTQERAHEIAQLAREMGLAEDDPIIVRATEIWWAEVGYRVYLPDDKIEPIKG